MEEHEVLTVIDNGGVFKLLPEDFAGRFMTLAEVEAIFGARGAFWQYRGEPTAARPHALLKSNKHSNGFIMCKAVLDPSRLCMLMASEMLKVVEANLPVEQIAKIGFVASSAYSALDLGTCLAWLMSQKYNEAISHVSVEKDAKGNPTIIRNGLDPQLLGLVINELMTTRGGSTWETKEAIQKCNGDKPAPAIVDKSFVLMHRSRDFKLVDESPVVSVFHFDMADYDVPEGESCPYCQAGSQAIKPKVDKNWQLLHAE